MTQLKKICLFIWSKILHNSILVEKGNFEQKIQFCRLIAEVRELNESLAKMEGQVREVEEAQAGLVKARNDLEREIVVKKKSLWIDRDRGQLLRSFYPSAEELSGHA